MSQTGSVVRPRTDAHGRFLRQDSTFREHVWERPEPGRLHLYVSLACPWAHRTLIVRALKHLEDVLTVTVVDPVRDERGWRFTDEEPDPVNGYRFLAEAYEASDPGYALRHTVPVLYDIRERRIVNNESSEIIRMLDAWSDEGPRLDPPELRDEMDALNDRVYGDVNNGVYQAGFAQTQPAYEEAFDRVFATLAVLEERLAGRRYLMGDALTLADVRLFVTLVRFDAVYVRHFKCNLHRIDDRPSLAGYLRDIYQHPGVAETVDFRHIKDHYFKTHPQLNPLGIVPKGPALDLTTPHGRERLSGGEIPGAGAGPTH